MALGYMLEFVDYYFRPKKKGMTSMKQKTSNNISRNGKKDGFFPVQRTMESAVTSELEQLFPAVAHDDPEAQFQVAEYYYKLYEEGCGGEKALAEAVKWYQKAAGNGCAEAQFEIGWCYQEGRGVEENPEKAVSWYRIAAEQGCPEAQYWLGWCYLYGKGVEGDMEEAVKWFRAAAEQGYEDAIDDLRDLDRDVNGYETIIMVGR